MTDYGACYNSTGSHCSGKAQPGTRALRDAIDDLFPLVGDYGIYNCRPSSGGGGLSTHGEGRGWDCALNANNAEQKALGDKIAALLIKHHRALGIQRIIWNHREWDSQEQSWEAYHGTSPHTDHLHIELCWEAARDNPLTVDYVKQVLGEEEDLTDEQAKMLKEVWTALYEKEGGKIIEHLDIIEKKLDELLAKL